MGKLSELILNEAKFLGTYDKKKNTFEGSTIPSRPRKVLTPEEKADKANKKEELENSNRKKIATAIADATAEANAKAEKIKDEAAKAAKAAEDAEAAKAAAAEEAEYKDIIASNQKRDADYTQDKLKDKEHEKIKQETPKPRSSGLINTAVRSLRF